MTRPLPLRIPPGIVKIDSPNGARGRYVDSDKIRFVKGKAEKWAGWNQFHATQLQGKARGAGSWTNEFGNTNVAFGTNLKLYALTGGDSISDITPIRSTGTLGSNPFSVTSGDATVTVTHASHGAAVGDFVTFGSAAAVGGITIDGEYQIDTKVDNNTYTIEHSSAATSTTTGGGASVTFSYEINTGSEGGVSGLGWGAGPWGEEAWSTPRTDGLAIELRHWSIQEYGGDILVNPSGGGLYLWEEDTDTEAEVVANAPTSARAMFLTGERFIMMLGTTTDMTVEWADRDDLTDWTPSDTNTANTRTLQSGSKLMNGVRLVDNVSLIWSDTSLYVFQYLGDDFVYDSRLAGTHCGLVAPKAFVSVSGTAYWMSSRDFHMFSGSVQPIPNSEDISNYIYANMDPSQMNKTWCLYDEDNNQVRWHYVFTGSTEPDRYVDVSLEDYSWTVGTLDRTTGTSYLPEATSMLLVSSDGYIFEHNVGADDDASAMEAFLTYGEYTISDGQYNVDVVGIIPDCERQTGNLSFQVFTKDRPNDSSNLDSQTATIGETDTIADIRVEGRHFSMKVTSNVVGGDFRLGIVNLEIQRSGQRR